MKAKPTNCSVNWGDHVAEIGNAHACVAAYVGRFAFDEHTSLLHHRDRVRYVHHDIHVVLDQHDRIVVAQTADQALHVVEIVDAHTRCWRATRLPVIIACKAPAGPVTAPDTMNATSLKRRTS